MLATRVSDDERIDQIVELVTQLAAGELGAREQPSDAGDDLDAVIVGVNMLAEELQAARSELEERVRIRTAELNKLNYEVMELTTLGSLLQACETREQAYSVIHARAPTVLPDTSGTVYLQGASGGLDRVAHWGALPDREPATRVDCQALIRDERHVTGGGEEPQCPHIRAGGNDAMCIPMSARGKTIGLLHVTAGGTDGVLDDARQRLGIVVGIQLGLSLGNIELQERLHDQATQDPLTGLYNRHFLYEWIKHEAARSQRSGSSLGVIMFDVDHFKDVNDVHGHAVGDEVLSALGAVIQESVRAGDVPCRYGGEEFLILVTDIEADALEARAEDLRATIERLSGRRELTVPQVTVSIGVALYPRDAESPIEAIRAADRALYAAKRAGRNRVASGLRERAKSVIS